MREQNELIRPIELLNERGHLIQPGWSRQPLWNYDRKKIKASALRIKEWDYYYILSEDQKRGITFTFSDLGYLGVMAVCWLDFEKNTSLQTDTMIPFPLGKLTRGTQEGAHDSDGGVLEFGNSVMSLRFETGVGKRILSFNVPGMTIPGETAGVSGTLTLTQPKGMESMNIASSWKSNRKRFYYNRKINCMPATGTVKTGEKTYQFHGQKDSAGLDWGRGAWTYQNRWYWSSASGFADGKSFGFNLGYGFSDRTSATENTLFYDHKAHKLEDVSFHFDPKDYTGPWIFSSSDGRLELDFMPLVDRSSKADFLLIQSFQHQVFGRFNGKVILDDGRVLILEDFLGFAEDVFNRW